MTTKAAPTGTIPIHQWTHDGKHVLILKCVPKDGRVVGDSNGVHYDFTWPLSVGAKVTAPDWKPVAECGGGLHGWPWGLSIGDGKEPDWLETWLVFAASPADVIDLGGKVKARTGRVVFIGDWQDATNHVLSGQIAWILHRTANSPYTDDKERGAASATGEGGAASATGERGAASATGGCSIAATTGLDGRVRGGPFSVLALAWWNESGNRSEMRCARIGIGDGSDDTLKANQWYSLNESGEFVECE